MKETYFRMALLSAVALAPAVEMDAQYNTDRLITIGRSALYYEDYVLSIQYFSQAIAAKPFLYEPWFLRGVAKFYLDDFVGAEADCSEAIRINPFVVSHYELRGLTRIRQEKYQEAIDDYTVALKYDPENQGFWQNRTICRMKMKDYEGAMEDADKMLKRWSKFARAYAIKAEVYLNLKDTTAAVNALNKSAELDPYDGGTWQALSIISLSQKNWKEAEEYLDKAVHLLPKEAGNYINRALARLNQNNLRGAMADYDTALDLEPNNFLGHYNRGLLRAQVGDDNRAIVDFDFVLKLEPDNIMALFNRALLLDKTGDLRGAIRDYTKVINEYPNFWYGLESRAACYRRLGMTKQAEADEFKVYKARLYKSLYGVQPRLNRKQQRKRNDIDPDKYNQLVVADDEMEQEYKNAYRGRVQNRQADLALMPMYEMSFADSNSEVESYLPYDKDVESFNRKNGVPAKVFDRTSGSSGSKSGQDISDTRLPLHIVSRQNPLDEQGSNKYLRLIDMLSDELSETEDKNTAAPILMRRAVANTMTQNFTDAIYDLTSYIEIDSMSALAYWQRAVCRMKENEFKSAESSLSKSGGVATNVNVKLSELQTVSVVEDLERAIALGPQNAYLYYDLGNVYACRSEWQRAIDYYTKAISIDGALADAYYNRGIAKLNLNNTDDGIRDLSRAGEGGLYKAYSVIKKYSK